jgi:hypothetical protein
MQHVHSRDWYNLDVPYRKADALAIHMLQRKRFVYGIVLELSVQRLHHMVWIQAYIHPELPHVAWMFC